MNSHYSCTLPSSCPPPPCRPPRQHTSSPATLEVSPVWRTAPAPCFLLISRGKPTVLLLRLSWTPLFSPSFGCCSWPCPHHYHALLSTSAAATAIFGSDTRFRRDSALGHIPPDPGGVETNRAKWDKGHYPSLYIRFMYIHPLATFTTIPSPAGLYTGSHPPPCNSDPSVGHSCRSGSDPRAAPGACA